MAGYVRQSSFVDGDTVTAALFNDEYNQLVNAFHNSTGHAHDGTSASGPVIGLIGDAGETSPNNKVLIDTTNNYIEFYVQVSNSPVQQIYIADGAIIPTTDSDIDLGTSSLEFKDLYLDGTAHIDTLDVDANAGIIGNATVGGTLGVTGNTTLTANLTVNGNTTLGNAASDTVTITADVASHIIPSADSTYTLGDGSNYWSHGYIDAITTTGNVAVGGNLTVTGTTTFNGGTITMGDAATDNVVFGADVDSNIIPDDDDTYDLGSSSQEWRNLYIDGTANIDSLVADTADINGGTVDGTIIGGSTPAAITGTAITGTSFVIGSADINEAELETIDGVTAGTVAASKAIVVDSNKDIASFRNITLTGELDAGSLDVSGDVDVDGTLETDALSINGTTVTSTAAELNILDGVTSTAAELNILDGVTSTAAELNLLDGVTSTTAELNILDGVTASAADINLIDGITNGTVIASKAIITDSNKDITGGRNITISGQLAAATLDISGDVDIDGTLEADAITVNGTTLAETISDTVGAMVTSNTESGITVAYDDSDNTLDFTVGTLNQDTTGLAATATALATARTIHGVSFDGTANIDLSEVIADTVGAMVSSNTETNITVAYQDSDNTLDFTIGTLNQDTTGNAATATALETARTIGGTSFDGSANIAVALSATATALATARTIHGVSFDGTANIDLSEVIQDTVGAMVSSNTESGITVAYEDGDGTLDFTVGTLNQDTTGTAALATEVTVSANNSTNESVYLTFVDGATGSQGIETDTALSYNPSTNTLTVANISVSGTQTIVDSVTMNANNAVIFEGSTADAHETTLTTIDATGDRTISLPNVSGTLPVLAAVSTTQITSTPEELNILDGVTSTTAELNFVDGSTAGSVVNSKAVVYGSSGEVAATSATVAGNLTVDTNTLAVVASSNKVGINQASPDVSLDLGANTDAVHVPVGTTGQRPGSPAAGYFRYNSTNGKFEGYTDEWGSIGGGSGTNMDTNIFEGDGSDTTFTLSNAPDDEKNLMVFVDGVFQAQNVYSVSGTTLTFATAPADGRVITVYHSTTTVGGSNNTINTMTGDNSDTTLTLSVAPVHENNTQVYFDGVYQSKANYAISGTTLTFSTAPATGVLVEAITNTNTSSTTANQLLDADSDTKIQVEESSDEDTIRFDIAGAEDFTMTANNFNVLTGSNVTFADSAKANFGAGSDLQIYHNGSNSYIDDAGTGWLNIRGSNVGIEKYTGEQMAIFAADGAVTLYNDNVAKFATTSTGVAISGTALTAKTTSSTANDRSGAGFTLTESATDSTRRANMYLDADNGAFGAGDAGNYFYIEKIGGGGEVSFINQDATALNFQIGGASKKLTISGNNLHLNGGTDARIQLGTSGAGATSTDNDTVHIRGDGDNLKLNAAGNGVHLFEINGSEKMRIDSAGHVRKPETAAFLARPSGGQNNLSVNVDHTIAFGTEVFDQNADFASHTFTAPVNGKYQLNASVQFYNSDSATAYHHLKIITSNRAYQNIASLNKMSGDPDYWTFNISVLADMDANDTAYVMVAIPNSGTAQADITTESYFSGFLAC